MKYHKNPMELTWQKNTEPDLSHYELSVRIVGDEIWSSISTNVKENSYTWMASEEWRNKPLEFATNAVDTVGNVSERSVASEPVVIDTLAPEAPYPPQIPGGIVISVKVEVKP